jgi:chromosome segregation ATPase
VYSLLLVSVTAQAAPRVETGDNVQRQAQMLMQQMAAEKTVLQKQNGELTAKLAELESRIKQLEAEAKQRSGELTAAQRNNEGLRGRVERDSERFKDLSERHGATTSTLRDALADVQLLQSAVQERDHWISQCQTKNEDMFKTNMDLLSAYRDKGALDALAQREPVTGLGSIKVENTVQEYQFRLEDLRTVKFESEVAREATP